MDLLSDWSVGLSVDLFHGCTNLVHVYFCYCRRPWWCRQTLGRGEYKAKRKKKLILSFVNYLLLLLQVVRENLEHTRNLTHLRWEWWGNLSPCCCKRTQIPRDYAFLVFVFELGTQTLFFWICVIWGQIRTLDMIRQRFSTFPEACVKCLQPSRHGLAMYENCKLQIFLFKFSAMFCISSIVLLSSLWCIKPHMLWVFSLSIKICYGFVQDKEYIDWWPGTNIDGSYEFFTFARNIKTVRWMRVFFQFYTFAVGTNMMCSVL